MFENIFDEYIYTLEHAATPSSPSSSHEEESESSSTVFEVPINTFIDCLNIFGTAGASATTSNKLKKWKGDGDDDDDDELAGRRAGDQGQRRQQTFLGGTEKGTGLRMSYAGPGYPLVLIMCVCSRVSVALCLISWSSAEDTNGPTATCEITTYDPEPTIELPFVHEDT
jgi:cell cycle checkpoint protein